MSCLVLCDVILCRTIILVATVAVRALKLHPAGLHASSGAASGDASCQGQPFRRPAPSAAAARGDACRALCGEIVLTLCLFV